MNVVLSKLGENFILLLYLFYLSIVY